MITKKPEVRYEDNAEQSAAISGWVCKSCRRFWGEDEHMARYCCATTLPCECGRRITKGWTKCDACRDKMDRERFGQMEAKPYDGSPVVQFRGDEYFFDQDALADWFADHDGHPEDIMLVFAELKRPNWRTSVSEILADDVPHEIEWDTSEIDKQIDAWVNENAPDVYWPSRVRVDNESLRELWNEAHGDVDHEHTS